MPVSARSSRTGRTPSRRPDHLGKRQQARPRRDGCADRVRVGLDDDDPRAGDGERPEQPEVLVGRRHDLVLRAQPEPAEHDVAAVRGAGRQRDLLRLDADEGSDPAADLLAQVHDTREVRPPAAAFAVVALELGSHASYVARESGPNVPALR